MNDSMKTCTKCGETKVIEEFNYRSGLTKSGARRRHSWCKQCVNRNVTKWQSKNPERVNARRRKYYAKNADRVSVRQKKWKDDNRFAVALIQTRTDAKRHGYAPCTATAKDLEAAFTGECLACGRTEADCGGGIVLDHSHETGIFRGWICRGCNKREALAVMP